jgi:hypothetical protein
MGHFTFMGLQAIRLRNGQIVDGKPEIEPFGPDWRYIALA